MTFTTSNSKVVIAVAYADDIKVHFRFKPHPLAAWREMTLPERKLFISRQYKWRLEYKIHGDEVKVGEYEFDIKTRCNYLEACDVAVKLLDDIGVEWSVLNTIEIHAVPITRG